jgi:DNA-directed RNA polymerase specialized sigma24 family protein
LSAPDPAAPVRTRAEIASAIRAFTPVQWVRLRKVAAYYAALGRLIEAEDLLQEAFRRALDGERKCPVTVDVVRFLAEAIRSIIDGELKKAKRRPVLVPLSAPGDPDPDDPTTKVPEPADPAPMPRNGWRRARKKLFASVSASKSSTCSPMISPAKSSSRASWKEA